MIPILEQQIRALLPTLAGWCTPSKGLAMADLILQMKPDVVVEIGVFGGSSLIPQALALHAVGSGVVHGIDPWQLEASIEGEQEQANIDWWKTVDLSAIMRGCYKSVLDANVERFVTIHPVSSTVAKRHFQDGSIDILHIDGCHSEISSVRDVKAWIPLVSKGGFIWFDDTNWESTAKAVALLRERTTQVWQVNHCALFQKGLAKRQFKPPTETPVDEEKHEVVNIEV